MALDASTQDNLARLTTSLKERAGVGDSASSMYVMWGFFTVASMVTAIAVCFTPQADRRFSEALRAPPPAVELAPAPMIARAELPPIAKLEPEPEPEPEPDAVLLARLKLLEEQLETITGSINAVPPPPPPPTGVTPTSVDPPKAVRTEPIAPVAPPEPAASVEAAPAKAAEAAPAKAAEPAPPPVVVAAAPEPVAAPRSPTSTTFGLDLGSEVSFGALRARWDGLRRKHPELARLTPRIAVRDNRGKVELRLIAGPFENASDAARACAGLFAKGVSCDGGLFDGQRMPAS